jgi:hypothetical protein
MLSLSKQDNEKLVTLRLAQGDRKDTHKKA